jgi:hypothetical protein
MHVQYYLQDEVGLDKLLAEPFLVRASDARIKSKSSEAGRKVRVEKLPFAVYNNASSIVRSFQLLVIITWSKLDSILSFFA